jgi:hypothetical protein
MKEKQKLKRKLDEYERCSQPLIDSSNSTSDNNSNTTTNSTTNNAIELDDQTPLSDAFNRNGDSILVKTETGSENDSPPSYQTGNKKRKVSSIDS